MAVTGGLLAVLLGAASGWIGVRRDSRWIGFAALAVGGLATGAALSFTPAVLYSNDQYPVSFGWVVGGAPMAVGSWLIATLVLSGRGDSEAGAGARAELSRLLFCWTKSIAAGTYLVPFLLIPSGVLTARDALWHTAVPVVAAAFLVLAAGFLAWEPGSPQCLSPTSRLPSRRRWRVRTGVIIGAYGVALMLPFVTETRPEPPPPGLALITAVLAAMLAVRGGAAPIREDRRVRLRSVRMLVEALVAGAAATALLARLV